MPDYVRDYKPTLDLIERVKAEFPFEMQFCTVQDEASLFYGVTKDWGQDDLYILDVDNEPAYEQLKEMIDCPHKDCAGVYPAFQSVIKNASSIFSLVPSDYKPAWWQIGKFYTLDERPEFLKGAANGCWKISKESQKRLTDWRPVKFNEGVDVQICGRIQIDWHLHYLIAHHHTTERQRFRL
jgi:hypothetical protein